MPSIDAVQRAAGERIRVRAHSPRREPSRPAQPLAHCGPALCGSWKHPDLTDHERPLAGRGRRARSDRVPPGRARERPRARAVLEGATHRETFERIEPALAVAAARYEPPGRSRRHRRRPLPRRRLEPLPRQHASATPGSPTSSRSPPRAGEHQCSAPARASPHGLHRRHPARVDHRRDRPAQGPGRIRRTAAKPRVAASVFGAD
jgi:hypothetical protein